MAPTPAHRTHATGVPDPSRAEPRGHGLHLRSWDADSDSDAEAWLRGFLDPEFQRWNTPLNLWTDLAGARESLRARARDAADGRSVSFRVTDGGSGATLGHIGVNEISRQMKVARVGYWVLPAARGRGVAGRALLLASRWAFAELGLHRLELGHAMGHEASCRIAERCGYRAEGTLREAMFESGRHDAFRDVHLHARLATDTEPAPPDTR
ncbi:GNAT family N-acetyltransferase [Streptomyces olivaceus]|uniref:GNAT family N-acetyltransferase n=1 Tax=Streptomyces olivaceus TaxID=47716 RepID=UPI001CCD0B39|nr:GNAT family N-acetyltransferase [Streptomyces olivaceus]MBZ6286575.1 GNAT family N-acetyltransferase [Streptomyces olivaceus]